MKRSAAVLLSGASLFAVASIGQSLAQTPPEPGSSPGVELVNISKNTHLIASAVPSVAVSPTNENLVIVGWRRYGLPVDTNALRGSRVADCHVAVSSDAGRSFKDTDLMPLLRNKPEGGEPAMYYCNQSWGAIGPDGTLYAGGATFTEGGIIQKDPKQGRAQSVVSTDGGKSWSKGVWAISLKRLGPGVKGMEGGLKPEETPWDSNNGFVDQTTGTLYVQSTNINGGLVASTDKGKTFGNFYYARANGFKGFARDLAASHGVVGGSFTATAAPGNAKCPCLTFISSRDNGANFTGHLVLQAGQFAPTGRTQYPQIAADPAHPGHFAIATFTEDLKTTQVSYTEDAGATWKTAKVNEPPKGVLPVTSVNLSGIGYTSNGQVLVAWRGYRNAGAQNIYVAMLDGNRFGPTIKLNPEPSVYPIEAQLGNYSAGSGDAWTAVTGNKTTAFVAFPYSPMGRVLDTWLARIPLARMK